MKKFKILLSLVLVIPLLGACIQIIQFPTETPTEIVPTPTQVPTQEPTKELDEYDKFFSKFYDYFYYIVNTEDAYSNYNIVDQQFFYDNNNSFWFGVTISGANVAEDDVKLIGLIGAVISQIIDDGIIKIPERLSGATILFVDDNMIARCGAVIIWEGFELYANQEITPDEFVDNFVIYPISLEGANLSEFNG